MKRRLGLRNLLVTSLVLMSLTSCEKDEFYQKDSYETFSDMYDKENPLGPIKDQGDVAGDSDADSDISVLDESDQNDIDVSDDSNGGSVTVITGPSDSNAGNDDVADNSGNAGNDDVADNSGNAGNDDVADSSGNAGNDDVADNSGNAGNDDVADNSGNAGNDDVADNSGNAGNDDVADNSDSSTGNDDVADSSDSSTGNDDVADNSDSSTGNDDVADNSDSSTGNDDVVDNSDSNTGSSDDNNNGDDDAQQVIPKSESFTQTANNRSKLDILWVIDDSGSMADEQAAIAYNFDIFIRDFIQKEIDFKMAITTTDTSSSKKAGKAVKGSISELTSEKAKEDKAQFLKDFSKMIQVGTRGSGTEKGLYASAAFASRNGSNFFRDDAYLVIVIVSDEEDQSNYAVENYVNFLKGYKTQESMVKTYSIVDMSGRPSRPGIKAGFARYAEASKLTGGYTANIYDDFYSTLSQMSGSIMKLTESFALNGTPKDGLIEVYVNGVLISSGWEYDHISRTVRFLDGSIPAAGSQIDVKYNELK